MPVDMSKYPDNWQDIRNEILLRAGGSKDDPRVGAKCEWCKVENYTVGFRSLAGGLDVIKPAARSYADAKQIQSEWHRQNLLRGHDDRPITVVLTIAHIDDPDPMNVDSENLAALCQRCHNGHDVKMRHFNRRERERKKAGQLSLFEST